VTGAMPNVSWLSSSPKPTAFASSPVWGRCSASTCGHCSFRPRRISSADTSPADGEVYDVTRDLPLTQELRGHASPYTTAIYTKVGPGRDAVAVVRGLGGG
jgi:hypothetical protein